MGKLRGFFRKFLSRETSFATGIVLALMGWTLARLVDGITANNTIEYEIKHEATTLADGKSGFMTSVVLSNLSADTAFTNLQAVLSSPTNVLVFSTRREDSSCAFESPGGMASPICTPHANGYEFLAPMLLAGKRMEFTVKYTRPEGNTDYPVLRIQPDSTQFRLIEPGLQTFVTRHQTFILSVILIVAAALLVLSVGAGVIEQGIKK